MVNDVTCSFCKGCVIRRVKADNEKMDRWMYRSDEVEFFKSVYENTDIKFY